MMLRILGVVKVLYVKHNEGNMASKLQSGY